MQSIVSGTIVAVLLTQINTTRCGKLLNLEMNTHSTRMNDVKMSSTRGQSAWVLSILLPTKYFWKFILDTFESGIVNFLFTSIFQMKKNSSETTRSAFNRGNIKNSATSKDYQWLVGVTDGDGTFYFAPTSKGYWTFTFKVSQSNHNLRLLYNIKKIVGVGSVSVTEDITNAEFRISNIQHIIDFILPIFDSFPLLTSKHFHYTKFKEAILLVNDSTLTKEEKNTLIIAIKSKT
jgi:hypothetical protein